MQALIKIFFWILPFVLMAPEFLRQFGHWSAQSKQRAYLESMTSDVGAKAQLSMQKLSIKTAQSEEQDGYIKTIEGSIPFSQEDLNRLIEEKNLGKNSGTTYWSFGDNENVAASALGMDKHHYFANSYLLGYKPFDTEHVWVPLFTLKNKKSYQYDHIQYGGYQDLWQNSKQAFFYTRGDCEDHAIILADWLISLGYTAKVAIGTYNNGGHAWVVLEYNNNSYVLEATDKSRKIGIESFIPSALATSYQPKFLFDRKYFWANTGSALTTNYSDGKWVLKSSFHKHL